MWWYGAELTWDGRELVSYNEFDYLFEEYLRTVEYTYNSDGIRTSKIVDGVEHKYYLNGSQIIGETWTAEETDEYGQQKEVQYLLMYVYDETGSPTAIKYRTNEYAANDFDVFFLEKNLQGDIVAIYDETGLKIGSYAYDAWGDCSSMAYVTDLITGEPTLEESVVYGLNPFRYRGYYFDASVGMYYLQSRYYNPQWGRFINPDRNEVITATPDQLTDKNLFAYCDNNPITRTDDDGEFWNVVIGAAIGAAINATIEIATQVVTQGEISDWGAVGKAALAGGISGGIGALTGGLVSGAGQILIDAVAGGVSGVISDTITGDIDFSSSGTLLQVGKSFARGGISSALGSVAGKGVRRINTKRFESLTRHQKKNVLTRDVFDVRRVYGNQCLKNYKDTPNFDNYISRGAGLANKSVSVGTDFLFSLFG